jgi:hypothetical protein
MFESSFSNALGTQPAFRSARAAATFTILTLVAVGIFNLLGAAVSGDLAHLLGLKQAGQPIPIAEARLVLALVKPVAFATIAVFILCAVSFTVWIGQAYQNLFAFGTKLLGYDKRDARLSFCIPIINLFRPFGVMTEIWKASDPANPAEDPSAWVSAPRTPILWAWWLLYLGAGILGWIGMMMVQVAKKDPLALPGALRWGIASSLGRAVDAIFAIALVAGIERRQALRARVAPNQ